MTNSDESDKTDFEEALWDCIFSLKKKVNPETNSSMGCKLVNEHTSWSQYLLFVYINSNGDKHTEEQIVVNITDSNIDNLLLEDAQAKLFRRVRSRLL